MRKYRNQPTVIDGHKFDSKVEARRYGELKLLEKAGEIVHLELQPKFIFKLNGVQICSYRADFAYFDAYTGDEVVEDVKSPVTAKNPAYRIKHKMMKAFHGIDVVEVLK